MCHRGAFKEDINEKYIICKIADNGVKNVVYDCEKLKTEREKVLKDFNKINNTKYNELLKLIEYHYFTG